MSSLPNDVRAFVHSKEPTCADECAKAADLSFQVTRIGRETNGYKQPGSCEARNINDHVPGRSGRAGFQRRPFVRSDRPTDQIHANRFVAGHPRMPGTYGQRHSGSGTSNPISYNAGNKAQPRNAFVRNNAALFSHVELLSNDVEDVMHGKSGNDADAVYVNDDNIMSCEYIVPVYINNKRTHGIRDSANFGPVLVSSELISQDELIPGKYSVMQGAFDARTNKSHKLPMASVQIRSPWFNYDENVNVEAVVCKLPKNVHVVIGNSLFKQHRQLTDVISVRRSAGQRLIDDTDEISRDAGHVVDEPRSDTDGNRQDDKDRQGELTFDRCTEQCHVTDAADSDTDSDREQTVGGHKTEVVVGDQTTETKIDSDERRPRPVSHTECHAEKPVHTAAALNAIITRARSA